MHPNISIIHVIEQLTWGRQNSDLMDLRDKNELNSSRFIVIITLLVS